MIADAQRHSSRLALLFFDLDDFKYINDTFGHRAGDAMLIRVAGEVAGQVRRNEIFGFQKSETIESWLPLFLFAVLFGLSMDYHVFLLSRIKERFDETGDNTGAVAYGMRSTSGLITGAALIMVTVFGSFVFGALPTIKMFGLGLATAIFVDATVVRMVLVPATMELLGDRNWWLPKTFNRVLPHINVEGGHLDDTERQPELV